MVIGQVLGCVVAWGIIRRQALHKLSFNTAIAALEAATAVIVFHVIAGNESAVHPRVWAAGFAAMIVEGVVSSAGVALAITALTGSMPSGVLENFLVSGVLASSCGTALALGAAVILGTQPWAAVLLFVIAVALMAGYRELASTRRRCSGLQLLYGFTEAMQHSQPHSGVVEQLLGTTRKLLGAEVAEVVMRDERGYMSRYLLDTSGFAHTDLDSSDSWTAAEPRESGLLAQSGTRDKEAQAWLKANAWTDGMLVPLRRDGLMIGTMAVANRVGDVATFDTENVKLFETLANHAAASLENHELIDQLQWEATHDTLTGLGNRREFYRSLASALETREPGSRLAVALVDLDRFKEINDTFGHHTGDTFLKWLGRKFQEVLPPDVMVARLGGDEFAVFVAYEGDASDAAGVIEKLLLPLWAAAFEIGDVKVAVSASTGVAVAPDHADDPVTLLQRADVAMYLAKGDRTGVAGYTTERDTYSPRRVGLASALRTAIDHGELEVLFQPKVELSTGLINGAEALVRWQHPREGLLLPDQFIPLAERTGLIIPLTDVVLERAISCCANWCQRLPGIGVAVNLSIGNLTNDKVVRSVTELLELHRLAPELLTLEVTESQIMEDERHHLETLEALADTGVTISIDDFGTGYASFAYLTRLPVHQVKIDKSFVGLMDVSPNDAAVVRSVIELGRDLGIVVVAEGVETESKLNVLRQLGCAVVQGYHIGVPMTSFEFEAMANDWNIGELTVTDDSLNTSSACSVPWAV